ncbi:MAG TPA: hypothetical protein VHG32_26260 [Thermoanaerobaculia bacterium]|nr:hypothetical protein [Thermoanaerobaculia bacterium]
MIRHRPSPLVNLPDRRDRQGLAARVASLTLLATLVSLAQPAAASAQELYNWTVGVMGGVGGSVDVKPGSRSFSNASWQVEGLVVTERHTLLGLRLGHLALGGKDTLFGSRTGADLSYVTLAGQYMFQESYYDSGVYLGLGAYRLGGNDAVTGASASKTVAGAVLGLTGDFRASRRVSVVIEASGHYIDIRKAHIYAMAHGGLAFHF